MFDDSVTVGHTFVPHGLSRPHFGVEIHLGKQGVGGPLVETRVIVSACLVGEEGKIVVNLRHDEVKHLLAG